MRFGERLGVAFLCMAVCDILWIEANNKWGIYNKVKGSFGEFNKLLYINAILCWLASALYIAGHSYDDVGTAFGEGAWLGSLVYAVFNLTTTVVAPNWRAHGFLLPIVDTLWGTILFGSASAFVSAVK